MEQKVPELTLPDLAAIKSIIEAVSQRGAFKANELATVGEVYNKLTAFLDYALAAANAAAEQKEDKKEE